jgi:hypothetical protein
MDAVLEALKARGVLDAAAAEWTWSYAAGRGGSTDTAVLELDLVDEDDLLSALATVHGLAAARPDEPLDPALASDFPADLTHACPLPSRDGPLRIMTSEPLGADQLAAIQQAFGRTPKACIAHTHHVRWARSVVFGEPVDERTAALQARLQRRRSAPDIGSVLDGLSTVPSLSQATTEALEYAASFLDFTCLLMSVGEEVRVLASRSPDLAPRTTVRAPGNSCAFAPALRFGGYFVGTVAGSENDAAFFDGLGRAQPRWAFVAPVPIVPGRIVVLFGDNGQRGMATRWIAKLTLVASRLGQQAGRLGIATSTQTPSAPAEPTPQPAPKPSAELVEPRSLQLTAGEARAIGRLRQQADLEGLSVERLVDALLHDRVASAPSEATEATALLGEVKGLFEQLAASLPSQLAQGIESAMREAAAPRPQLATPRQPAATTLSEAKLVTVEPERREVASYRARRKVTSRVKL